MLDCQNFGRSHNCRLQAVFNHRIHNSCGNRRFARADISLNQSVHNAAACNIPYAVIDSVFLRLRRLKGQQFIKFICIIFGNHKMIFFVLFAFELHKSELQRQQFLKYQSFSCFFDIFRKVGKMNLTHCPIQRAQIILQLYFIAQRVFNKINALQGGFDCLCNCLCVEILRCTVYRLQALYAVRPFDFRRIHSGRRKRFFNLTVQHIFIKCTQCFCKIFIIKNRYTDDSFSVREIAFVKGKPFSDKGLLYRCNHRCFNKNRCVLLRIKHRCLPAPVLISAWIKAD